MWAKIRPTRLFNSKIKTIRKWNLGEVTVNLHQEWGKNSFLEKNLTLIKMTYKRYASETWTLEIQIKPLQDSHLMKVEIETTWPIQR